MQAIRGFLQGKFQKINDGKRILAAILLLCIVCLHVAEPVLAVEATRNESCDKASSYFEGENFRVECTVQSQWNQGYTASAKVINTGTEPIENLNSHLRYF